MKIGPVDIGPRMLALVLAVALAAMADVWLWLSGAGRRAVGRLGEKVRLSLVEGTDEALANGAASCAELIRSAPESAALRLYHGTILHRLRRHEEAGQAFQGLLSLSSAGPRERAMACVGAGAAAFEGQGEKARGAAEAKTWLEKALQADPGCADAKVALAEALLWEDGAAQADEVLRLLDEAENARPPPGLEGSAQLYIARAAALAFKKELADAQKALAQARAVKPGWDLPETSERRMVLATLAQPGVKLTVREKALQQYERQLPAFGPDKARAANILAVGWWRTREETRTSDYLARGYPRALQLLSEAMKLAPGDRTAFLNAAAILEDRLYGPADAGGLVTQLAGEFFDPCPPAAAADPWRGGALAAPGAPRADLSGLLRSIHDVAGEELRVLREMLAAGPPEAAQQREARLRQLAAQLLVLLCTSDARQRQAALDALVKAAEQLKSEAGSDPRVLRAYAHVMLRKKDFESAAQALRAAREKGDQREDLLRALEAIGGGVKLANLRPRRAGWFGKQPVAGATFRTGSAGPFQGALSCDGQEQPAHWTGSQILCVLGEECLKGGTHRVEVQATDGYGNRVREAFEFYVDRTPPRIEVEPKEGQLSGAQPVWTITLSDDAAGPDLESVRIIVQGVGEGASPVRYMLVDNGLYQRELPRLNVKARDRLPGMTFQASPGADLSAGQYSLRVTCADKAGNKREQSFIYRIAP